MVPDNHFYFRETILYTPGPVLADDKSRDGPLIQT